MSLILGEDPCEKVHAPTHISILTASSSILLRTIVATVGNALVVLVVFLNPNRDMRKPFHYFVANLSIADLIVGLITGSMSTIYHIFAALRQHDEGTFWDGDDCRILRILHGVSAQPKSPGDGPKSRHHATSDLPALSRYCWFQVWCGLCSFCFR